MITSLTKEQKARLPEFIDKWTRIGLSTEPADRKEAEVGIREAYEVAGLKATSIVWCGSPLSQGLTRSLVFGLKKSQLKIRASVGDSVWDSVWDSVRDSVGDSVRDSVGDSVRDSVRASVGDSVRASVWDSVYGQHDANWLGFYDYFRIVCGLEKETQKLCGLWKIAQAANWWLPHEKICWVSERHNVLNRNGQGQLHKDLGPALSYPDGWSIYALNGVRMEEKWVITPPEQINPKEALAVQNAEVRRELIRKVGIERMLSGLKHRVLQKRDNYELLSIRLSGEVEDARYLKMINPSIGVFHVEGVDPKCATVEQALNWRNQNFFENAEILT